MSCSQAGHRTVANGSAACRSPEGGATGLIPDVQLPDTSVRQRIANDIPRTISRKWPTLQGITNEEIDHHLEWVRQGYVDRLADAAEQKTMSPDELSRQVRDVKLSLTHLERVVELACHISRGEDLTPIGERAVVLSAVYHDSDKNLDSFVWHGYNGAQVALEALVYEEPAVRTTVQRACITHMHTPEIYMNPALATDVARHWAYLEPDEARTYVTDMMTRVCEQSPANIAAVLATLDSLPQDSSEGDIETALSQHVGHALSFPTPSTRVEHVLCDSVAQSGEHDHLDKHLMASADDVRRGLSTQVVGQAMADADMSDLVSFGGLRKIAVMHYDEQIRANQMTPDDYLDIFVGRQAHEGSAGNALSTLYTRTAREQGMRNLTAMRAFRTAYLEHTNNEKPPMDMDSFLGFMDQYKADHTANLGWQDQ